MKYFIAFFGLLVSHISTAQIITTIGGCLPSCPLGDGGPATAAAIDYPFLGEFDSKGNFYFCQALLQPRIRKIDTNGIVTTVAGNGSSGFSGDGGPATNAALGYPYFTVDAAGNIYIADCCINPRVRKVDVTTGIIHTIAGNGTVGSSGDGGPATAAVIAPNDLVVDGHGNIYVSENGGNIRKINTAGIITKVATSDGQQGMCFGRGKLIFGYGFYVCTLDTASHKIDTIAGAGSPYLFNGDNMPATNAHFKVFDITCDQMGNIYFADETNDRVRKIDMAGIITTVAGTATPGFSGDGGPATAAQVNNPEGVAIDACGNLYISDDQNRRIRKVTFNPSCILSKVEINEIRYNGISIFPNPVNDILHIENIKRNTSFLLRNILGTVVQNGDLIEGNNNISTNNLPLGIYILDITDGEGKKMITKIIKQ